MSVTGLLLIYTGPLKPVQIVLGDGFIAACSVFFDNGANDIQTVFFKLDQLDFI
ncbi:hypothetical protein D3C76_1696280 [compost metagenome]